MPSSQQATSSSPRRRIAFVIALVFLAALIFVFVLLMRQDTPDPAPPKARTDPTLCGQSYRQVKAGVLSKVDTTAKVVQVTDITDEDFGSPGYFYYDSEPMVFDQQCTPASFGSLQPDQHLSVYYTDSQHFFIQTD